MTAQHLRVARKKRGWTQQQAARHLGVSQAYVSMLERSRRNLPGHLVKDVLKAYEMSPLALPWHGDDKRHSLNADVLVKQLAALGYPGFSYLRARPAWNPAELLVAALEKDDLEQRVAEALPWLVLKFHDLNWEWVMREAKLRDLQNRLGFVVTLARELAGRGADSVVASQLLAAETRLQRSKLAHVGTFCRESLSQAERHWLRQRSSREAKQWNLLADLSAEHLASMVAE